MRAAWQLLQSSVEGYINSNLHWPSRRRDKVINIINLTILLLYDFLVPSICWTQLAAKEQEDSCNEVLYRSASWDMKHDGRVENEICPAELTFKKFFMFFLYSTLPWTHCPQGRNNQKGDSDRESTECEEENTRGLAKRNKINKVNICLVNIHNKM